MNDLNIEEKNLVANDVEEKLNSTADDINPINDTDSPTKEPTPLLFTEDMAILDRIRPKISDSDINYDQSQKLNFDSNLETKLTAHKTLNNDTIKPSVKT